MISPQGYNLGKSPKNKNPFWDGGETKVDKIYAEATVDEGTGVPSVSTTKKVSGGDITFGFDFHNLKGERGTQGPAGATGATGPAGAAGAAGSDGAPGATGATGPQGPEGPKGDTGAVGPAGSKGEQGSQGPAGEKGDTGEQGPQGPEGPKGEAGVLGVSPTARVEQTGDNQATIYVTDASGETSAVLTGEAGPVGPKGDTGEQGPAGPKGDTGDIGPQGPEGQVGPKGDTGEQGTVGPKGDTGEQGPQGPEGQAGSGVPVGGTSGQVLTKKSGTNYDTEWKNPTSKTVVKNSVYPSFSGTLAPGNTQYATAEISGTGTPIIVSWSLGDDVPITIVALGIETDDYGKVYVYAKISNPTAANINMDGTFGTGIQLLVNYVYL